MTDWDVIPAKKKYWGEVPTCHTIFTLAGAEVTSLHVTLYFLPKTAKKIESLPKNRQKFLHGEFAGGVYSFWSTQYHDSDDE